MRHPTLQRLTVREANAWIETIQPWLELVSVTAEVCPLLPQFHLLPGGAPGGLTVIQVDGNARVID